MTIGVYLLRQILRTILTVRGAEHLRQSQKYPNIRLDLLDDEDICVCIGDLLLWLLDGRAAHGVDERVEALGQAHVITLLLDWRAQGIVKEDFRLLDLVLKGLTALGL